MEARGRCCKHGIFIIQAWGRCSKHGGATRQHDAGAISTGELVYKHGACVLSTGVGLASMGELAHKMGQVWYARGGH